MADLIKALTAAGKISARLVAAVLIVAGGLLTIGGLVYRVFVQPEWTFDEAQRALWPFFLAGIASLTLGWFVDRVER
jgi:hypothetical protein